MRAGDGLDPKHRSAIRATGKGSANFIYMPVGIRRSNTVTASKMTLSALRCLVVRLRRRIFRRPTPKRLLNASRSTKMARPTMPPTPSFIDRPPPWLPATTPSPTAILAQTARGRAAVSISTTARPPNASDHLVDIQSAPLVTLRYDQYPSTLPHCLSASSSPERPRGCQLQNHRPRLGQLPQHARPARPHYPPRLS